MTRKVSRGNFLGENRTTAVLSCVLGPGGWRGGGVGITPLYGLSEVWAAPKGMAFGLFMCEKGVSFIHIGLIKGVFFTLAWHRVLNTHINSIYVSRLFMTIYTIFGVLESIYHMTIGSPLYRLL